MKASEVMSQISNMTSFQTTAKVNSAKNSSFQDIMGSNLQSKQDSDNSYPVNKKTSPARDSNTSTVTNKTSKTATNDTKKANETESSNVISNDKDNVEEKINQLVTEVKEILMDNLKITEEQLEDIMSTLGLNYLQLLEPSNLAQVFVEANGLTDKAQMLTSQLLSDQFSQLVEQVGQVDLEALGLTTEDVAAYIENLNLNNNNAESFNVAEEVITAVEKTEPEEGNADNLKTLNDESSAENNEIKVDVQKYTTDDDANFSDSHQQKQDTSVENANLNTILNNVSKVSTVESFGNELVQVQQVRDIVNQVVEQIKVVIKPEQTSMEMNLNPESLGKVNLLVAQKDGALTAQFTVQNEVAKEALESQMQILKENFNTQGLKVDAVEVTISNLPFSQDNMSEGSKEQYKSSGKKKNINLADLDIIEEDLSAEEAMKIDMMHKSGNSVDYSA
ncbi:flagellar hook-length control protein FliK [Anaerosporobacter sp.]